ncbi:MAG: hypothetical protein MPEBLZ_00237 [Candidatus Methanoperedens nitroreducens]|uniref:Uncharacterized protein n=2 Tax=Candidatus Methanoperedens TaxID=1392997 RepID=A0A0N8KRK0_9EURY|nr:MAG: hypothetical protein MPEBLZ_00237 [Candidatus Methanoperedens sp. BLZ1]
MAIASAVFAISYQYTDKLFPRAIILLIGGIFSFSLTVALVKHRLFQEQRIEFLSQTEERWLISNIIKSPIKRRTDEIQDVSWYEETKAYHWLRSSMVIISSFLIVFGIYYLVLSLWEYLILQCTK